MNSFKQMVKDGTIKRADAMKVALADIHEEPGFNLRVEGDELAQSIHALALHIAAGGIVPPLEVRAREEGGVWIVDGHRRSRAYRLAVADMGASIEHVPVVAFVGNDVDRIARIMTSAEGRGLSPLEVATGYKRLAAFGLTSEEIGRRVGKTRAHVDQLLLLANANRDVHDLVTSGAVAATVATDAVRKHGDKAGAFLVEQVSKARAAGKAKATAGTIEGKPLPRKVVTGVLSTVEAFTASLSIEAHQVLNTLSLSEPQTVGVDAAALLQLIECQREVQDARDKQAAKAREQAAKAAQADLVNA